MGISLLRFAVLLLFATSAVGQTTTFVESFPTDPLQRGWRVFGNTNLFSWNAANQNLQVTWDSSHTNSYFYIPIGTILARSDDFSMSLTLRLDDASSGVV